MSAARCLLRPDASLTAGRPSTETIKSSTAALRSCLLCGVVVPDQFQEDIAGVATPGSRESSQLLQVLALAGQLDQDVHGVNIAGVGKPAQLVKIAAFSRQLDQLVLRVTVTNEPRPRAAQRDRQSPPAPFGRPRPRT